MIVAIPVWQGRVSPVFDVARQVRIVELAGRTETSRRDEPLPDEGLDRRADRIAQWGVTTLICGAVSRPLEQLLTARGVEVTARVCGNVDEVLDAFRLGDLAGERFAMPGCCHQRRRRRRGCRRA